jgi:hypothetical protein
MLALAAGGTLLGMIRAAAAAAVVVVTGVVPSLVLPLRLPFVLPLGLDGVGRIVIAILMMLMTPS